MVYNLVAQTPFEHCQFPEPEGPGARPRVGVSNQDKESTIPSMPWEANVGLSSTRVGTVAPFIQPDRLLLHLPELVEATSGAHERRDLKVGSLNPVAAAFPISRRI